MEAETLIKSKFIIYFLIRNKKLYTIIIYTFVFTAFINLLLSTL